MHIREKLDQFKSAGAIAAVLMIIGACIYAYMNSGDLRPPGYRSVFFTTDDGKTWFEDSVENVAPYTKDGKQAVQAHVYSCNGGKVKFVGYLERMSPEAKAEIDKYKAMNSMPDTPTAQRIYEGGVQVKRPGEPEWKSKSTFGFEGPPVKCPDGTTKDLTPFVPVQ
jgi:hypothetical protein